jgi:hypothetical protein
MTNRLAYFVDETFMTPNGIVPAVAEENVPGYSMCIGNGEFASPWYWGKDIATAQKICDDANAKLGLTPAEARDIVASSIAAQNREQEAREAQERRWAEIKKGR